MPEDVPPRPEPEGFRRIFDESESVVDPASENLTNGSLAAHPDQPEPVTADPDGPEVAEEPE